MGLDLVPKGFDDPVLWRKIRWATANIEMTNGRMKWSAKNRVRVGFLTPNPPHIHSTNILPMYGIAEKRFVMTVAPQNLICPHGRRYPIKAVAIETIRIVVPRFHVSIMAYEP